ncbi:proline-, glutamic acid- and leucine-rich protein 1 [Senna tora]|uniref:Proline-, glutamic acid- and leucine-rich protein 1 n=1 Tax=Senna tora TaxID=362788 RepID=A0A834SFA9_9FABA|nr:proline-, glutamic acid- and leucine-rich protein 1 [Senna tora]
MSKTLYPSTLPSILSSQSQEPKSKLVPPSKVTSTLKRSGLSFVLHRSSSSSPVVSSSLAAGHCCSAHCKRGVTLHGPMAAFDHFRNMYDVAVKPRLLHTLVREHIPEEKHPFSNPSELSRVISMVKTHCLLAESFTESMDPKQIESWKSAVDSWVDRILILASSDTVDKCWAGVSLLGFTCQECSSARFLKSYSGWFQKLFHFLQSPGVSHFVRVASLASLSDLFSRLSGFPNIKKDGSSFAAKVVQPVLKLLNDDSSEDIWEGALHLLCTIMTSFPFSVHRNYDTAQVALQYHLCQCEDPSEQYRYFGSVLKLVLQSRMLQPKFLVESAVASKLLSGGCSQYLLKKLAYCLALLPKSKGDEESWSMMMQKILVVINDQLNSAFQGLEEETKCYELTKMLVQPGKDPPPALGGYIPAEEASYKATKRSKQSPISNVSALMLCCCTMLTNLYSYKVNVPVRLLLALVDRVLMVNGSLPQISLPFITAKQQEDICSELPVLHSYSLELLTAVIKGVGSQLLPHAAFTVRIITIYFKTCALPELRIKVYSVTKILLISMGLGMALCLAQEVINNAFVDLSTIRNKNCGTLRFSNSNAPTEALLPCRRKRKHGSTIGSVQLQEHVVSGLEEGASKNHLVAPISLRIAALEAVEALITVAGGLRSEKWKSKVDDLLIVIAIDSFEEGWANEEITMFGRKESDATSADLQLAALRALLASFLSFSQARPPHLAQGLELFRRGKQLIGTKLAEFCAHALLALEVLIHPRALPLVDYSSANNTSFHEGHRNFEYGYALGQTKSTPYGLQQVVHDAPESDDDLCHRWLENEEEPDVPSAEGAKHDEGPSSTFRDNDPKLLTVHNSSGTQKPEGSEQVPEIATCTDTEMRVAEDEVIVKSDQTRESIVQFQEPISCRSISVAEASCGSMAPEPENHTGIQIESGQGALTNKDGESASLSSSFLQKMSDSGKDKDFALKFGDGDSSGDEDAFPDIVDADPDSDSN